MVIRLRARERGLFAGAAIAAVIAGSLGVPVDFVLFALTLAGVALSNMYPEARSAGRWLAGGWHVTLGYVLGFFVLLAVPGWHPTDKRGKPLADAVRPPAVQYVAA